MYRRLLTPLVALLITLVPVQLALAHCDALNGPVVKDARQALEKSDVTPVLKWVLEDDEEEVRRSFAHALEVRALSPAAEELADRHFFETVVRLHRAAEGEAFTGLKPADFDPGVAVRSADYAVANGSLDELEALLAEEMVHGLRQRFQELRSAREHAGHSVEAGRHFTHQYAHFIHYAKGLHDLASGHAPEHGQTHSSGAH